MTEEIRPICLYVETCLDKKEGTRDCVKCEHHLNYWTEVMIRDMEKTITRLEQENKELSFAIEKCLENAGIECDDEEQAIRSLSSVGSSLYAANMKIEELKQENKELKEKIKRYSAINEQDTKDYAILRNALEEIRDYCKFNFVSANPILNKINEVLNDKMS